MQRIRPLLNRIGNVVKKPRNQYIICAVLLLPLLGINLKDSHNWGGDFAQYIQQAENIVEGKSQSDTYYVFNPGNAYLAPPSYSVGFPVLLAPVYAAFGNNIFAFNIYMSLILVVSGLLIFAFLRQYLSGFHALLAVLLFVYNPWMLSFKASILSDLPFLLFFAGALVLFKGYRDSIFKSILLGGIIAFSMMIRSIGVILLVVIAVQFAIHFIRFLRTGDKQYFKSWKMELLPIPVALITYVLVTTFLLPIQSESISFFSTLFHFRELGSIVLKTLDYYIYYFQDFFQTDTGDWGFISSVTKATMLTFLILGLINSVTRQMDYKMLILFFYIGIVLSFPNTTQGFRYLVPIAPLLILYIIKGMETVHLTAIKKTTYLSISIFLIIALQYRGEIKTIVNQSREVVEGPQKDEAQEVFKYIKEYTEPNDTIVFTKPRVLGLYAERYSFTSAPEITLAESKKQLEKLGYDYILQCDDLSNPPIDSILRADSLSYRLDFSNSKFRLYKHLTVSE